MRECEVCGIDISSKKATARTCSPKCRKDLSRLESVTPNVTLGAEPVTLNFKFYTVTKANGMGRPKDEKSDIRQAKYWYDVPLAAIPVIQKDWPKMPDYMNGRQYFLWWKNNFAVVEDEKKGELGTPVIHNPFRY
jgi:hypothetical protein